MPAETLPAWGERDIRRKMKEEWLQQQDHGCGGHRKWDTHFGGSHRRLFTDLKSLMEFFLLCSEIPLFLPVFYSFRVRMSVLSLYFGSR